MEFDRNEDYGEADVYCTPEEYRNLEFCQIIDMEVEAGTVIWTIFAPDDVYKVCWNGHRWQCCRQVNEAGVCQHILKVWQANGLLDEENVGEFD